MLSWKNPPGRTISSISIQRSYDSLRNFTTIGSVVDATSESNGFLDANPPFSAMFYRILIVFEGGAYEFSPTRKAVDTSGAAHYNIAYNWDLNGRPDTIAAQLNDLPSNVNIIKNNTPPPPGTVTPPKVKLPTFPSSYIFTSRLNSIVLHLPDAASKTYRISVFDDQGRKVFDLTNLKEDYFILDKGNFPRAGWYDFELYDQSGLVERNKFAIPRDAKDQR